MRTHGFTSPLLPKEEAVGKGEIIKPESVAHQQNLLDNCQSKLIRNINRKLKTCQEKGVGQFEKMARAYRQMNHAQDGRATRERNLIRQTGKNHSFLRHHIDFAVKRIAKVVRDFCYITVKQ